MSKRLDGLHGTIFGITLLSAVALFVPHTWIDLSGEVQLRGGGQVEKHTKVDGFGDMTVATARRSDVSRARPQGWVQWLYPAARRALPGAGIEIADGTGYHEPP